MKESTKLLLLIFGIVGIAFLLMTYKPEAATAGTASTQISEQSPIVQPLPITNSSGNPYEW